MGGAPHPGTKNFELMVENKTVFVTLTKSAVAKIKVEVRLEDLFRSEKMTATDRMNFLHNVLNFAATEDLADELMLRGYYVTKKTEEK